MPLGAATNPIWARSGRELFYGAPGGQIMVVAYSAKAGSFVSEKPRQWLEKSVRIRRANFDVAPDGKRLAVMLLPSGEEEKPTTQVVFLLNFFDELRRRVR